MKSTEELRAAFPEVDKDFENAVQAALENVQEERSASKRGGLRFLVLAAAMVLIATAGLAVTLERWGIADFITNHEFQKINMNSDEEAAITTFEPVSIETQYARMTVTEAIYDGYGVYIVVEAEALREKTMLVRQAFEYDEPAYISVYGAPRDMTITEYAKSLGYDWVASVVLGFDSTTAHYYSGKDNEDGTASFMIWAYVRDEFRDQPELHITIESHLLGLTTQYSYEKEITLQRAGERQSVRSIPGESATFEQIGVNVTGVELIRTPITTYAIVSWDTVSATRMSTAPYRMLRIEDGQGNVLPVGANPIYMHVVSGEIQLGQSTCDLSTLLLDELPDTVTIVENVSETDTAQRHTFHLQ